VSAVKDYRNAMRSSTMVEAISAGVAASRGVPLAAGRPADIVPTRPHRLPLHPGRALLHRQVADPTIAPSSSSIAFTRSI